MGGVRSHPARWLAGLAVVALLLAGGAWWVGGRSATRGPEGSAGPAASSARSWLSSGPSHGGAGAVRPVAAALPAADVLRAWDGRRAEAFAAGDLAALRRLYVPGSRAGTADRALLRGYLDRGLRVEGMRVQVLALDVLAQRSGSLRLRVTDRLVGAVAVGESGRVALPRDEASTRVVVLRRVAATVRPDGAPGLWRVASVRSSSPTRGDR